MESGLEKNCLLQQITKNLFLGVFEVRKFEPPASLYHERSAQPDCASARLRVRF